MRIPFIAATFALLALAPMLYFGELDFEIYEAPLRNAMGLLFFMSCPIVPPSHLWDRWDGYDTSGTIVVTTCHEFIFGAIADV